MKHKSSIKPAVSSFIVAMIVCAALAKPNKPIKEILHYFAKHLMANTGIVTNASGSINLHENSVSKGKPQALHIELRHLEVNSTYRLTALVGNETNLTLVAEFVSDDNGNAHLDFRDKANGHGGGKNPLPASLSPLTSIHQLSIEDTNSSTVLTADLSAPDKFVFFLKRDISANDIRASLQINSETHKARLRVAASGLEADTDYTLALNDSAVTTASSDAKGQIRLGWELENAADILSLHSVSLLDSGTNVVLSATLP